MIFGRKICTINRSVLIVRPKQPYIDWANSMDDGGPLANLKSMRKSPNTFLVDEIFYIDDLSLIINEYWETLFEIQLNNWMRDPDVWPEELTREMFEQGLIMNSSIWCGISPGGESNDNSNQHPDSSNRTCFSCSAE